MKRDRESTEPNPAVGSHPLASKPLSAFDRIVVTCNDCGDVTVLDDARLAELSAVPTFGDLWRLAFCAACREGGSTAPANMELRGETARRLAAEPEWSTKRVFGQERSDPFPTLPRKPLFGR